MPSSFTKNLGVEKPASGEQTNTWGITANRNFDVFDRAISGSTKIILPSAGTTSSPNTLAVSNGALSNGQYAAIEYIDSGDLGDTAYVQLTPEDAERIIYIRNSLSGGRNLVVFQGTYSAPNACTIANGQDSLVNIDGAGVVSELQQNVTYSSVTTSDVTATGAVDFSVATIADLGAVTTVDINGGTIDATVIGGNTAESATFTDITATGDVDFTGASSFSFATIPSATISTFTSSSITLNGDTVTNIQLAGDAAADTDSDLMSAAAIQDYVAGASLVPVAVLDDLANVNVSTPADGQVLEYNNTSGEWQAATRSLADLPDVDTTGVTAGDALVYNGSTWVPDVAALAITSITQTATSKTLVTGERTHVTAATQTITLPASPSAGDLCGVVVGDFKDTVVARNGSTIMGLAEDLTIDSPFASLDFQYIGTTWRLV